MLTTKIKAIVAVGLFAAAFWSGWAINDYRWQAKYSKLDADRIAELHRINNEYVADVAIMAEAAQNLRDEVATKDQKYNEVVKNADTQQSALRRDLRNSNIRLSVLARNAQSADQAAMPEAASNPGATHAEARCELHPDAAERIIAIGNQCDDTARQLTALQEVCSITTASNPLTQ